MQILRDCNTFRWSSIALPNDPTAKLIRMKVHMFSDSTLCVGVSNPDPSKNWATKLEDVWNEHGFLEQSIWQPEKRNSFGIVKNVQKYLNGQTSESFDERIIFIFMFNDIEWTKGGKTETCLHSVKEMTEFAIQFEPGHWCFLGPASENTW